MTRGFAVREHVAVVPQSLTPFVATVAVALPIQSPLGFNPITPLAAPRVGLAPRVGHDHFIHCASAPDDVAAVVAAEGAEAEDGDSSSPRRSPEAVQTDRVAWQCKMLVDGDDRHWIVPDDRWHLLRMLAGDLHVTIQDGVARIDAPGFYGHPVEYEAVFLALIQQCFGGTAAAWSKDCHASTPVIRTVQWDAAGATKSMADWLKSYHGALQRAQVRGYENASLPEWRIRERIESLHNRLYGYPSMPALPQMELARPTAGGNRGRQARRTDDEAFVWGATEDTSLGACEFMIANALCQGALSAWPTQAEAMASDQQKQVTRVLDVAHDLALKIRTWDRPLLKACIAVMVDQLQPALSGLPPWDTAVKIGSKLAARWKLRPGELPRTTSAREAAMAAAGDWLAAVMTNIEPLEAPADATVGWDAAKIIDALMACLALHGFRGLSLAEARALFVEPVNQYRLWRRLFQNTSGAHFDAINTQLAEVPPGWWLLSILALAQHVRFLRRSGEALHSAANRLVQIWRGDRQVTVFREWLASLAAYDRALLPAKWQAHTTELAAHLHAQSWLMSGSPEQLLTQWHKTMASFTAS